MEPVLFLAGNSAEEAVRSSPAAAGPARLLAGAHRPGEVSAVHRGPRSVLTEMQRHSHVTAKCPSTVLLDSELGSLNMYMCVCT